MDDLFRRESRSCHINSSVNVKSIGVCVLVGLCVVLYPQLVVLTFLLFISKRLSLSVRLPVVLLLFSSHVHAVGVLGDVENKNNVTSSIIKSKSSAAALSCNVDESSESNSKNSDLALKRQALIDSVDEQLLRTCVITEKEASRRIQSGSVVIVDIRPSDEFHSYRVANSINLPYSIKSKAYLKSRHLFLVGDKADLLEMGLLCRDLKKQGFKKVSFVKNGLENWRGKFIGKNAKSVDSWAFGKIEPREFTSLKSKINWLILDVTGDDLKNRESSFLYQNMDVVSFSEKSAAGLERVKRFTAENDGKYLHGILVVSKSGENYRKLSDYLTSNGVNNAFFLEGGKTKYAEYQVIRQAFLARLKRGPVKPRSCSGT